MNPIPIRRRRRTTPLFMKMKPRAATAVIFVGLQSALKPEEQLLGFTRGRIAGGIQDKLNLGPEALFSSWVNIGLTEKALILQHLRPDDGRPTSTQPHRFGLDEIQRIEIIRLESFSNEPLYRLTIFFRNSASFRLRIRGVLDGDGAKALQEVFSALIMSRSDSKPPSPVWQPCPVCGQALDQPYHFCPYCGKPSSKIEDPLPGSTSNLEGDDRP